VHVVDCGSFSAGARVPGMTPSAIGKLIVRLEARLATTPIHAIHVGKSGRLPARVRAMLDFLVANVADNGQPRP
jgi:DNA-binding transcriptional LysR family regulator